MLIIFSLFIQKLMDHLTYANYAMLWLLMGRDDLSSQIGIIKSASVSLEGKLAPFALHLYLAEMAIFQEVLSLYYLSKCILLLSMTCQRDFVFQI